jgi:uncharacterized protein (TIGR00725 family)
LPHILIGILGGRLPNTNPEALKLAEYAGAEIARRGNAVICGGEDGIGEAACRGCKQAGGLTLGILKGNTLTREHPYTDFAILTAMDVASNNILVWSSAGLLAFDGRFGTLNEIALALDFGKPLICLGEGHYLRHDLVNADTFAYYGGYDVERVPEVLDRLEAMIRSTTNRLETLSRSATK